MQHPTFFILMAKAYNIQYPQKSVGDFASDHSQMIFFVLNSNTL